MVRIKYFPHLAGSLILASAAVVGGKGLLDRWEPAKGSPDAHLVVYADKLAQGLPTVCNGITKHVATIPGVVGEKWTQEMCNQQEEQEKGEIQKISVSLDLTKIEDKVSTQTDLQPKSTDKAMYVFLTVAVIGGILYGVYYFKREKIFLILIVITVASGIIFLFIPKIFISHGFNSKLLNHNLFLRFCKIKLQSPSINSLMMFLGFEWIFVESTIISFSFRFCIFALS